MTTKSGLYTGRSTFTMVPDRGLLIEKAETRNSDNGLWQEDGILYVEPKWLEASNTCYGAWEL